MTSLLQSILDLFSSNKEPILIPEISEADLLGIVQRFIAPAGEKVKGEGRFGNGVGFGEEAWIEKAIQGDLALASKPHEDALSELLTYQGLHAIATHRVAHELYQQGDNVGARQLSQAARRLTAGIEIHPGAKIGKGFFIDHGAGVVIGETVKIGDNVMLYHSVTLGNDGKKYSHDYRHPQLGNNVVLNTNVSVLGPVRIKDGVHIGAGAKIIGDVTLGENSTIAPGIVIRQNVPAGVRVVHQNGAGDLLIKVAYVTDSVTGNKLQYSPNKDTPNPFEMEQQRLIEAGISIDDEYLPNPLQGKSVISAMLDDGWRREEDC